MSDRPKLEKLEKRKVDELITKSDYCGLVCFLASMDSDKRTKESLEQGYEKAKGFLGSHVKDKKRFHDVLGTAFILYLDLDNATEHFIESGNIQALENTMNLGLTYGRYDSVRKINDYGLIENIPRLRLTREEYCRFLASSVFPQIQLEKEEEEEEKNTEYFVREDILTNAMEDLGVNNGRSQEFLEQVVARMDKEQSRDIPRKLLLSLYSGNDRLIEKQKRRFEKKKGIRRNIDDVVMSICEEQGFDIVGKLQTGDYDDYYPLSAHLYAVEKDGQRMVLKENIRYRIDFSCLDGYNMELELYSRLDHEAFPGFFGSIRKEGIEFIQMGFVEGEGLSRYTTQGNLLDIEKSVKIISDLAEVLQYLHSQGVVYADMKDKNVMYDPTREKIRLLDFGMASDRLFSEEDGEEFIHEVVSNAEYACPETIILSRMYKKSDVFQLGILFYKLLTGSHPFAPGEATTMYEEKASELLGFSLYNLWKEPRYDHPVFETQPELQRLVSTMLDKDYRRRPTPEIVKRRLNSYIGCTQEEEV